MEPRPWRGCNDEDLGVGAWVRRRAAISGARAWAFARHPVVHRGVGAAVAARTAGPCPEPDRLRHPGGRSRSRAGADRAGQRSGDRLPGRLDPRPHDRADRRTDERRRGRRPGPGRHRADGGVGCAWRPDHPAGADRCTVRSGAGRRHARRHRRGRPRGRDRGPRLRRRQHHDLGPPQHSAEGESPLRGRHHPGGDPGAGGDLDPRRGPQRQQRLGRLRCRPETGRRELLRPRLRRRERDDRRPGRAARRQRADPGCGARRRHQGADHGPHRPEPRRGRHQHHPQDADRRTDPGSEHLPRRPLLSDARLRSRRPCRGRRRPDLSRQPLGQHGRYGAGRRQVPS